MIYLKENKTVIHTYLDFLKHQEKVIINDQNVDISSLDGLEDVHQYAKSIEIGHTAIKSIESLSKMKDLRTIQLYSNNELKSLDGLIGLNLEYLTLYEMKNLTSFGSANFSTEKLVIHDCPNLDVDLSNIKISDELSLTKTKMKDLSFLKNNKLKIISINDAYVDSLYGIQFCPDIQTKIFNKGSLSKGFDYHRMFYDQYKRVDNRITDYWKDLYEYWANVASRDGSEKFDFKEMIEIIVDSGMPEHEIKRLFTEEEQRLIFSTKVVNKFNL